MREDEIFILLFGIVCGIVGAFIFRFLFGSGKDTTELEERVRELEGRFEYPMNGNANTDFENYIDYRVTRASGKKVDAILLFITETMGYQFKEGQQLGEWVKKPNFKGKTKWVMHPGDRQK